MALLDPTIPKWSSTSCTLTALSKKRINIPLCSNLFWSTFRSFLAFSQSYHKLCSYCSSQGSNDRLLVLAHHFMFNHQISTCAYVSLPLTKEMTSPLLFCSLHLIDAELVTFSRLSNLNSDEKVIWDAGMLFFPFLESGNLLAYIKDRWAFLLEHK